MQLLGDAADNPDQRIAEDVKEFVDKTLANGSGLLRWIGTVFSLVVFLWVLSAACRLGLCGTTVSTPGYPVGWALI